MTAHDEGRSECLSVGLIMALLDRQLAREEDRAARAHLQGCARCQQVASELAAIGELAQRHLGCLDDETIATYVDHRIGRRRGSLTSDQLRRVRRHLARCPRCRKQVAALESAYPARGVVWHWARWLISRPSPLGGLVRGRLRLASPEEDSRPSPVGRLARAAAWAAVATAAFAVLLMGLRAPPSGLLAYKENGSPPRERAHGPTVGSPARGMPAGELVAPAPVAPRGRAASRARTLSGRLPDTRSVSPTIPRKRSEPETALVPESQGLPAETSRAREAVRIARRSGDAGQLSRAALALGSAYHRNRQYRLAADSYREAASAAQQAHMSRTRIDALVLRGAALAEMGQLQTAKQQLEEALALAQQERYEEGEQNARVQLELLSEEQIDPGSSGSPPAAK